MSVRCVVLSLTEINGKWRGQKNFLVLFQACSYESDSESAETDGSAVATDWTGWATLALS